MLLVQIHTENIPKKKQIYAEKKYLRKSAGDMPKLKSWE